MDAEIITELNGPFLKTCLELSFRLRPHQKQPSISPGDGHVSWRDSLTDESTNIKVDTEICATGDGKVLWRRLGFSFPRPPELNKGIYSKTHFPNCYVPVVWNKTESRLSVALWLTKAHVAPLMSQPLLMEVAAYEVGSLTPEILEKLHQTTRGILAEENNQLSENVFRILKAFVTIVVKYGRMDENRPTI